MPGPESAASSSRRRLASPSRIGAVIAWGVLAMGWARAGDDNDGPSRDVLTRGAELFAREWLPDDAKGPGGDGLGPVYNETSCVACHFQGGPGGAGPTGMNVEILSGGVRDAGRRDAGVRDAGGSDMTELHPGLRAAPSVVLHRFGVDPMYKGWRLKWLGDEQLAEMVESVDTEIQQVQQLIGAPGPRPAPRAVASRSLPNRLTLSQLNTPALFGSGRIDAIPEAALVAASERRFPEFPEVRGRVNRLKDGRIGRFGWKAETPDLREFVLTACANELGLEVPGHHQAASPLEPEAKAKGLDLTPEECEALVAYVRHLPAPTGGGGRSAGSQAHDRGRSLFESAGCATCHQPRLGEVDGIYSDLLLHDLGRSLVGSGSYSEVRAPDSTTGGVKPQEWRTPPLWGFRDSGPYLHDGRARDLEEAVAFHGGEAANSARRFFKLLPEERLRVQAFLRSLSPPAATAR